MWEGGGVRGVRVGPPDTYQIVYAVHLLCAESGGNVVIFYSVNVSIRVVNIVSGKNWLGVEEKVGVNSMD